MMKSYRQKLAIWIDEKINQTDNLEVLSILNDVKKQIKGMETEEEYMVNKSYDKGYTDADQNRGRTSNYYKTLYKMTDYLKSTIKK
jgi:hypothetical protein